MAYSKKENFTNFGKGKGLAYYGSQPQTFVEDIALVTNCENYHCMRMIKAQVKDDNTLKLYDTTIWVGLINEIAADKEDEELSLTDMVKFVALGCPPYQRDLIEFGKNGTSDLIEKLIEFEESNGEDIEFTVE